MSEYELTESSDTDNTDLLSGSSVESSHRRVDGDTSTAKGSSLLVGNAFRNGNGESTLDTDVIGVTSLSDRAVLPLALVGTDHT